MQRNLFQPVTTIGAQPKKRGRATRGRAPKAAAAPWYAPVMPNTNDCDARRARMSLGVRKAIVELVYDHLDPLTTGAVSAQTRQDIFNEIEYLIQIGKDAETCDHQRFMVEYADEYEETKRAEEVALKNAINLEAHDDEKSDEQSDSESLDGFIVGDDVVETEDDEEELPSFRRIKTNSIEKQTRATPASKHKKKQISDDEENNLTEEGTNIEEVD